MQMNPQLKFLMTYQERSSSRNLTSLLYAFDMTAHEIPLSAFLHEHQLIDGSIEGEEEEIPLESFHSVFMFVICKRTSI